MVMGKLKLNTYFKEFQRYSHSRENNEVVKGNRVPVRTEASTRETVQQGSSHCCTLCMKVVKRVNPKSSHHKETDFCYFPFILCVRDD